MLGAGSVFESWALACTPQLRVKMMRKTVRAQAGHSPLANKFLKFARNALSADEIAEAKRRAAGASTMIIGTAGHIDHGKTALVRAFDRNRH
jgi:hypothetical protein